MAGEVRDECGIAAVYLNGKNETDAPLYLYRMLLALQHRGQLSAGMTTYNPDRSKLLSTYKRLGMVNEVFRTYNPRRARELFENHDGSRGIGHVRYATFGRDDVENAHPVERYHGRTWKWFSFCFNGNIANFRQLRNTLERWGYQLVKQSDSEILLHFLTRALRTNKNMKPSLPHVFSNLSKKLDGAYNICYMNADGDMAAARDPLGFRPLSYAVKDGKLFIASESNALIGLGIGDFKSLEPGKMIFANDNGFGIRRYASSKRKAHCMFEWVYFANVSSVLENRSVYLTRMNLGKELARRETEEVTKDHVVVSVPDTSRPAADGFAYELGVPSKEGLIRNRFVGRTFIDGKVTRKDKVKLKFTVLRKVTRGKKLFVIDDSIVRGNTSKQLVKFLKRWGGAKEVHLRISCPPIVRPCFYGIDMSTIDELIAAKHIKNIRHGITEKESAAIAMEIGADSLVYQSVPSLVSCINIPRKDLCTACLNGDYPTNCGKRLCHMARRRQNKGRTYEPNDRMYDQIN